MEVNEAGDDDLEENTTNQWGKFWLIWMSLLAVCSACVAFAWIKFPENKVVQRSQYVDFSPFERPMESQEAVTYQFLSLQK
jgi:hypothetical protein